MMRRKDRAYQQAIGHFLLVVISELTSFFFSETPTGDSQMFQETFRMPMDFKKGEAWVEGCSPGSTT